jgi:hypothetical protein
MAHFTQLGLSGSPDKKPATQPVGKTSRAPDTQHPNPKKSSDKHRKVALVSLLIATSLLGVFLLESGCSKESDKTSAIVTPNQSVVSQPSRPILTHPVATSTPVASQPPAKKNSRQRKLSASTYTNAAYGVSFRYPTYGSLKEDDEANLELDGLGPLETNFVQPGGTTISAVELPRKLFAGTDFNTAFFNVSVNPKLTAAECEQFAFPEKDELEFTTSKTKVGATEFEAVEAYAEAENNQADVKFYHVFQNGSCYEFALGLETATEESPDEVKFGIDPDVKPAIKPAIKPVDRNEVFRKLNWMLSTVRIQSADFPATTAPAVADGVPITPSNTEIDKANIDNANIDEANINEAR